MKGSYFLLLASGWLLSVSGAAQPVQPAWTLETCIRYALANNIQIKQQALTAEQSANAWQQSKLNLLPSLNARASYNMGWGLAETRVETPAGSGNYISTYLDNASQNFAPAIYASVNLFEGLQKINTVKRNRADYLAALQDTEQQRNNIALEVTRAFLQVLLAKEVLATAEKSRESVSRQHEMTRKLVAAGSQPYSTLLEMEAQLASEEVQFVTARNNVDLAYLSLKQLINLNNRRDFEIEAPVLDVDVVQREEVIRDIYKSAVRLPQIKTSELRLESAKHALAVAKGRYWPTISLSASYGSGAYYSNIIPSENFWDQINRNSSPSIGFGLNIPLFQNWSIVTGAKNAKLSYHVAALEVDRTHQQLYKEIQQAVADASAAYNRYRATEQTVTAMQESFRYTQEKFDVGLVHATDYTIAKNNLFKAESDMLQAKYQYIFQTKIIDFYKGFPITL